MEYKGKKFTSKAELFDYLRANKTDLVDLKKGAVKHTDAFSCHAEVHVTEKKHNHAVKVITDTSADTDGVIYRTVVGNAYYVLDSHDDVHIKGCFTNSISARTPKRIAHLHDHKYSLEAKVGKFSDVYEYQLSWKDLGVDAEGKTWALLGDSAIKRALNEKIFDQYKDGEIDQHSVGMVYSRIELALDDEDDEEHYKVWLEYIDQILNKSDAEKQGYFWVVKEAKLIEISAVIAGSNPITPTLPVTSNNESKTEASVQNNTDPAAASRNEKGELTRSIIYQQL